MSTKELVEHVTSFYYCETVEDVQFYILEQFEKEVDKEEISKYFSDINVQQEDLQIQLKNQGIW